MDDVLMFKRKRISTYFLPDDNAKSFMVSHSSNPSASDKNSKFASLSEYQSCKDAIECNDTEKVKHFLGKIPRIDVNKIYDDCCLTLLHFSVGISENEPEIVELLLNKGGDPNNTNIEDSLTPLHLSALYDFDRVMEVLVKFGGKLDMRSSEGYNCFEIVKQNIENEMKENCFKYLFLRSRHFRQSMGPRPSSFQSPMKVMRSSNATSISDGSVNSDTSDSCESSLENATNQHRGSRKSDMHSAAKRLFPDQYEYLISEDSIPDHVTQRKKTKQGITMIPEESGVIISETSSLFGESLQSQPQRGIASTTAPSLLDSLSTMSYFGHSASTGTYQATSKLPANQSTTKLPTNQPTGDDLKKLETTVNQLKVSTSALQFSSTSGLFSPFSGSLLSLQTSLALKYSSELHDGVKDLNLIREWGNLRVDFVQKLNNENTIKSYKNYLLLNTKRLKNVNFSANHLKTAVIDSREKFQTFLDSIFYIGNVRGNQELEPLVNAKVHFQSRRKSSKPLDNTITNILEIWKSGLGVKFVNIFCHSSESEVIVNQATMIDAMGCQLDYLRGGNLDGTVVSNWSQKMRNQFGSSLLYDCYKNFLVTNNKILPSSV